MLGGKTFALPFCFPYLRCCKEINIRFLIFAALDDIVEEIL